MSYNSIRVQMHLKNLEMRIIHLDINYFFIQKTLTIRIQKKHYLSQKSRKESLKHVLVQLS